jgi:hypothetical protein
MDARAVPKFDPQSSLFPNIPADYSETNEGGRLENRFASHSTGASSPSSFAKRASGAVTDWAARGDLAANPSYRNALAAGCFDEIRLKREGGPSIA